MKLNKLLKNVTDKSKFQNLNGYISFCNYYLDYITENLQAIIVSQNENNYCFYQYTKEVNYQITRPINTNLMISINDFNKSASEFLKILHNIKDINKRDKSIRKIINNSTYTLQQSIGAA